MSVRCADAQGWNLGTADGLQIRVLAEGASWISCRVPLADGQRREVLLGFDDIASHRAHRAYIGAIVGRWANRIAGQVLRRAGKTWPLACLPGATYQLHGGPVGFNRVQWTLLSLSERELRLGMVSPDGDQGFPGELSVEVSYRLIGADTVEVALQARVAGSEPTPVGMTNHAYFQLDGAGPGDPIHDVRRHTLQVAARRVLPVDAQGLPTGAPVPVEQDGADFRTPRTIETALDRGWLLDAPGGEQPAATLRSADGRMTLELFTTLPALQAYTGEFLGPDTQECQPHWPAFSGIALEAQFLPDSPHHPEWPQPDCWLQPGGVWAHRIRYRFRGE